MQQFFNNRYTRLAALVLGLGTVVFLILWLVARAVGLQDFPPILIALVAFLGVGALVYKFIAHRVF